MMDVPIVYYEMDFSLYTIVTEYNSFKIGSLSPSSLRR